MGLLSLWIIIFLIGTKFWPLDPTWRAIP